MNQKHIEIDPNGIARSRIPWWVKIAAKIVLSRAGIPYRLWRRMRIFRHGEMTSLEYARSVFDKHLAFAPASFRTLLEIGPGDSLMSALLAAGRARETILVDSGSYADTHAEFYRSAASALRARGAPAPDIPADAAPTEVATLLRCRYLTNGVESLRSLPEGSVDFSFSNAVLEHIPLAQFDDFCLALYRAMGPGSSSSHAVDFQDHLQNSLNNLRFSDELWESPFFSRSGFYTNRLRLSEVIARFETAGFVVELVEKTSWSTLPLPIDALHPRFGRLSEDDLRVLGAHLLLRKP